MNCKNIISGILISTFFIFIAFGSSETESDSSSSTKDSSSSTKTEQESDECSWCDGRGKYKPDCPAGFVCKTKTCGYCNGTGKKQ